MIKTVIFDLDDTMYDFDTPHKAAYEKMCTAAEKMLGVPAETFGKQYDASFDALRSRLGMDYDIGAVHSRILRFQYVLEQLHKPLFPYVLDLYHIYWGEILSHLVPEPGIEDALKALKEKGVKIGVGTNMTALIQYMKLNRLGFGNYLDFMVTSDESNCDKPGARFFELCVEKAGCKADECLYIGDSFYFDYEGATNAGLRALWYNRKNQPEDGCKYVIHSYYELLRIIEN